MKAYVLDPDPEWMTRKMVRKLVDLRERQGVNQFGQFIDRLGVKSQYALELMLSNVGGLLPTGAASGIDIESFGTVQYHPLGTLAVAKDGCMYRYSTAGASALVVGNVIQGAAPIANHLAITAAAEAIGAGNQADPIVFTPGATGGAANLYAEGYLNISVTPGLGNRYRVSGHAAITSSVAFNLYLDPDSQILVALTTSSKYGLHHNPYKNVIQTPTANTQAVVGVAVSVIPANTTAQNYGWLQTKGPASVLINGTPTITAPVVNSGTTAGAADLWTTAAAAVTVTPIGFMLQVGVSGQANMVRLNID